MGEEDAIPLRIEDADAMGLAEATEEQCRSSHAQRGGIRFRARDVGDICYAGPCDPNGGGRVICYFGPNGCGREGGGWCRISFVGCHVDWHPAPPP